MQVSLIGFWHPGINAEDDGGAGVKIPLELISASSDATVGS